VGLDGCQRARRVDRLVRAVEGQVHGEARVVQTLQAEPLPVGRQRACDHTEVAVEQAQRGTALGHLLRDHVRLRSGGVRRDHGRAVGDDAGLLPRDLTDRRSELGMVQLHVAEHRDPGVEDVGRVEAAAHAHLDHPGLDPCASERPQAQGRRRLEERHHLARGLFDALDVGSQRVEPSDQVVDPHRFAVDAEPFAHVLQVR
jgi:hypothetical protein